MAWLRHSSAPQAGRAWALLLPLLTCFSSSKAAHDTTTNTKTTTAYKMDDAGLKVAVLQWTSGRTAATEKYHEIDTWETSEVKTMAGLFEDLGTFNDDIDSWQTSSVKDMSRMFAAKRCGTQGSVVFNQPLNSWNTRSVRDVEGMFANNCAFDQNIDSWQVGSVTSTAEMFAHATSYNQPVNSWQTSSTTSFVSMFQNAHHFNQNINAWRTHSAQTAITRAMFRGAAKFNQNIAAWTAPRANTGPLDPMKEMFVGANAFAQDLSPWSLRSAAAPAKIWVEDFCIGPPEMKLHTHAGTGRPVCRPDVDFELRVLAEGPRFDVAAATPNYGRIDDYDNALTKYIAGGKYTIAPPRVNESGTVMNRGTPADLTYFLGLDRSVGSGDHQEGLTTIVDCDFGVVVVDFDKSGTFHVPLMARDLEGNARLVQNYTFGVSDPAKFQVSPSSGWSTSATLTTADGYFSTFTQGGSGELLPINAVCT